MSFLSLLFCREMLNQHTELDSIMIDLNTRLNTQLRRAAVSSYSFSTVVPHL